jgi:DNA-binding transcriptional regulator YbjK
VIIEKRASVQERAATLAQALSQLDTSHLALSPKVRQLINHYVQMSAMSSRPQRQKKAS